MVIDTEDFIDDTRLTLSVLLSTASGTYWLISSFFNLSYLVLNFWKIGLFLTLLIITHYNSDQVSNILEPLIKNNDNPSRNTCLNRKIIIKLEQFRKAFINSKSAVYQGRSRLLILTYRIERWHLALYGTGNFITGNI